MVGLGRLAWRCALCTQVDEHRQQRVRDGVGNEKNGSENCRAQDGSCGYVCFAGLVA